MIKYVLILHLCSFISQPICTSQTVVPIEYKQFHDCITQGYIHAYKGMMELDKDKVEKEHLAIRFECRGVDVPEVTS